MEEIPVRLCLDFKWIWFLSDLKSDFYACPHCLSSVHIGVCLCSNWPTLLGNLTICCSNNVEAWISSSMCCVFDVIQLPQQYLLRLLQDVSSSSAWMELTTHRPRRQLVSAFAQGLVFPTSFACCISLQPCNGTLWFGTLGITLHLVQWHHEPCVWKLPLKGGFNPSCKNLSPFLRGWAFLGFAKMTVFSILKNEQCKTETRAKW